MHLVQLSTPMAARACGTCTGLGAGGLGTQDWVRGWQVAREAGRPRNWGVESKRDAGRVGLEA